MKLIVDLEATCWEIPKVPDLNEIIDVGIVVTDDNYTILDTWTSFVRPKINTKLSSYCRRLTSIRQSDVDAAPYLSEAVSSFHQWYLDKFKLTTKEVVWFTWGSWDLKCLKGDCYRNDVILPFGEHRNLKDIYFVERNCEKTDKLSVKEVLLREGICFADKLHRGLSDAIATAKIVQSLHLSIGKDLVLTEKLI
jgi:inhibitor of KinA sporulation pathway (predicted exonuclease)